MGAYKFLLYTAEDGIATITMNRPEVYNALNDEITFELQDAWKAVARDERVRVVVLTGEGKAFCSGQDLKAQAGRERSFLDSLKKRYNPIIRAMRKLPKPIICRLNGVAAGAGCSLALACDLIVASEQATLIEVFVNIGLVPDSGSSFFLPRAVGLARAFELCAMGSPLRAPEAVSMGLINKAVPADQLDSAVKVYAEHFATAPTKAIGLIKTMLQKSASATLEEMLEYEAWCQEIAGSSADYREGVAAFLEKRKARFAGN
jgi:2-(1,2-epoxy-1,2-dihydrophenyl)acetyl-CoA isomerase